MAPEDRVIVSVSRQIDQTPDRVFDAWLDAKNAGKWLFATPTGQMVKVEIDPRVGGSYTIVERREGEEVVHTGKYLETDRPRRLVFTLAVEKYSKDANTIAVDFVSREDGTEVRITHDLPPEAAPFAGRTEQGWAKILERLDLVLRGRE